MRIHESGRHDFAWTYPDDIHFPTSADKTFIMLATRAACARVLHDELGAQLRFTVP